MKRDRSRSRSPLDDRRSRSRSPRRPSRPVVSKRCIISNIPYDLKWQEIKDLFRQEVGDVIYVELFNTPDGKPKGTGVIEFKDIDTATQAIDKMHRYQIKDRKLVVREERERDRRQNEMGSGRGGGGGGGGGQGMMGPGPSLGLSGGGGGGSSMGGMGMGARGGSLGGGGGMGGGSGMGSGSGGGMGVGGVNPQVLQQLGVEGPVTNSVFVSNLDYKVNWKKLKDVFRLAGNVIRAEIKEDKDGKSRGIGTVMFETPVEAVQAISMFNNQTLYDRTMRVKMDSQGQGGGVGGGRSDPLPSGLKSLGPSLSNYNQIGSSMGGGMGMGMDSGNDMGMSSMGMGGGGMRGMDNMGSQMNRMGGGMGGMSGGMGGGMSGGMGGMTGMGNAMGGMSGGMGTGMSGMGGMGSGMGMGGMGDSFSSGMSAMGGMGSGMGSGSMGGGGMNDNFGMMSMSGGSMGNSSGYGNMMEQSRGSGMGSYSSGGGSRMDYGGRDRDRGGSNMPSGGDMKTRADKSTVIVKNLPYSMDWQSLKAKFQTMGDIRFAEISKNDKGKSNGWGLVSFRREDDALVAVQKMNRVNFDGRDIVVKLLT